jgi:type 1 fimbriae regulatory protein FimB/type 1 fimbriae regulatory protein FimE
VREHGRNLSHHGFRRPTESPTIRGGRDGVPAAIIPSPQAGSHTLPTASTSSAGGTWTNSARVRPREYLTPAEIERLMKKAGDNRYGHRDATMVLIAYRHGLRPTEACGLKWDNLHLDQAKMHVSRAKNGTPSVHPLSGVELRALRRLKRESPASPFVFVSERGAPFTTAGFRKMVARLGVAAKFKFPVHPHMFRHAAGYKLANDGHDTRALQAYLGHKNIQHTVRYTELDSGRFRDFRRD